MRRWDPLVQPMHPLPLADPANSAADSAAWANRSLRYAATTWRCHAVHMQRALQHETSQWCKPPAVSQWSQSHWAAVQ